MMMISQKEERISEVSESKKNTDVRKSANVSRVRNEATDSEWNEFGRWTVMPGSKGINNEFCDVAKAGRGEACLRKK